MRINDVEAIRADADADADADANADAETCADADADVDAIDAGSVGGPPAYWL